MTSSNVSNLLVQVKSINVEMQSAKTGPQNAALFEKTLKLAGTNAGDSMATSSNVNMLPMRAFLVDDTAAVIDQNFNINSSDPDSKESSVSYENWYKL